MLVLMWVVPAATQRTLILYEQEAPAVAALERDPEQLGSVDAVAFTFDAASLDSFREAHGLLQRVAAASGNTMACLLVAIEDEAGMHEVRLLPQESGFVAQSRHQASPPELR